MQESETRYGFHDLVGSIVHEPSGIVHTRHVYTILDLFRRTPEKNSRYTPEEKRENPECIIIDQFMSLYRSSEVTRCLYFYRPFTCYPSSARKGKRTSQNWENHLKRFSFFLKNDRCPIGKHKHMTNSVSCD